MKDELLWSWDSDNPSTDKIQLPLSISVEKLIVILAVSSIFYIMLKFISPMLGEWSYYLFIIIFLVVLPLALKNYKTKSSSKEQSYIKIYNNHISVNYYGYHGSYKTENIIPSSIKIKNIIVTNFMGIGWSKGLCFKTTSPNMIIKIPLPLLEPDLSELKESIKALTRQSNWTNNP